MTITILQYLDRLGNIIEQENYGSFTAIEYVNLLRIDSYFFDSVPKNTEFIRLVNEDGTVRMYWIFPDYSTNLWGIRDWVN